MIEAGTVGVLFTVKDDASAVLERLATQFNELQITVDRVKESLASIGGDDGALKALQEQLTQTGRAGADASQIITDAFGKVDGAVDSTISRVNALRASFVEASAASKEISFAVPGTGGVRRAAEREAEDVHFRNPSMELPGGQHATFGGDSFTPGSVLVAGGWATNKLLEQGGDLVTQQKLLRDRLGIKGSDANVDDATRAAIRYATGGPGSIIGTNSSRESEGHKRASVGHARSSVGDNNVPWHDARGERP